MVSSSLPFKPFSLMNYGKLSIYILVLSAKADPKAVLPEHLGPIKKKTYGIIALLVSLYTSSTVPNALIQ